MINISAPSPPLHSWLPYPHKGSAILFIYIVLSWSACVCSRQSSCTMRSCQYGRNLWSKAFTQLLYTLNISTDITQPRAHTGSFPLFCFLQQSWLGHERAPHNFIKCFEKLLTTLLSKYELMWKTLRELESIMNKDLSLLNEGHFSPFKNQMLHSWWTHFNHNHILRSTNCFNDINTKNTALLLVRTSASVRAVHVNDGLHLGMWRGHGH